MKRLLLIGIIAIFSISFLAACSSSDKDEDSKADKTTSTTTAVATGTQVQVSLKEFSIAVDPDNIGTGDMTFIVNNDGQIKHEFVVFKTDLAPNALPTEKDGEVNEDGEGIDFVDELEDLEMGSATNLSLKLDSGNYVLFCNVEGHYAAGMNAGFTVK